MTYRGVVADSRPEAEVQDEVWYEVEWLWEVFPLDGLTWGEAMTVHLAVWAEVLGDLHLRSPAAQEGSLNDSPGGSPKWLN